MSHIRLIGLLLFITAITLALAAAATRTTHVQVSSQWLVQFGDLRQPVGPESSTTMPPGGSTPAQYTGVPAGAGGDPSLPPLGPTEPEHAHTHDWDYAAHQSHFQSTAIPIAWPLLATAAAGLLLWFIQPPAQLGRSAKKRTARRKRRR